jgi:hypothetical protein
MSLLVIFIFIIMLIWWFVGFIGYLMSIVCWFYNGSTTDKALGCLVACIAGPIYWLFFIYNSNYCTRLNPPPVQQSYYE